jgi:hypothetical protein
MVTKATSGNLHRWLACGLMVVATAGCGPQRGAPGPADAPAGARDRASPALAKMSAPASTLALQHSVRLDVDQAKLAEVFESVQAACREPAAQPCDVLDSRIEAGRYPSASLRLRAKPDGIQQLVALLGRQGRIGSRSTSAEDLAVPLGDNAKRLSLLKDYRSQLEAMRTQVNKGDVDALIKLTQELNQVQGEFEALSGEQAQLTRRVETQVLEVSFLPSQQSSFWRPVSTALSEFGGSLSQGTAGLVTCVAYLLPWTLALLPLVWAFRRFRRWRQTAKGR